jgi:hypothetical protein
VGGGRGGNQAVIMVFETGRSSHRRIRPSTEPSRPCQSRCSLLTAKPWRHSCLTLSPAPCRPSVEERDLEEEFLDAGKRAKARVKDLKALGQALQALGQLEGTYGKSLDKVGR